MSTMDFGCFRVKNVPQASMANPQALSEFRITFQNFTRAYPLKKDQWNDSKFAGMCIIGIDGLSELPAYPTDPEELARLNSNTPQKKQVSDVGVKKGDKVQKDKNGNNLVLRDCVPQETIIENLQQNFFNIHNWVKPCQAHLDRAIIVSAGPSVNFEEIKQLKVKYPSAKIVAVKHSYKRLLDNGIVPDFCCLIDTRPIDKVSTLGYLRTSLLDTIHPNTVFFVGTRGHASYAKFLKEKGARVYGYHVFYTKELKEAMEELDLEGFVDQEAEDAVVTLTATNAGMTAVGVMHVLGFREMHIFGMDGDVPEPTEEQQKEKDDIGYQKYYEVEMDNGKTFWTTGEFIYMGVDCMHFWSPKVTLKYDVRYHFHGEGTYMREIWDTVQKQYQDRPTYSEIFAKA